MEHGGFLLSGGALGPRSAQVHREVAGVRVLVPLGPGSHGASWMQLLCSFALCATLARGNLREEGSPSQSQEGARCRPR